MSTTVDAVYEDGVFTPDQPVPLEEKARVHLVIEAVAAAPDDDDPTGWKTAMELKGCIKGAPPDMATNHDKYLYGTPDVRAAGLFEGC